MFQKKHTSLFLWTLSIVLSFSAGYFFHSNIFHTSDGLPNTEYPTEIRESGYTLINPLLECQYSNDLGNTKLKSIDEEVRSIVSTKQNQEISVYYRDLLNGPWYGYNEDAAFAPQSLLKLPIIFAYLKIADEEPSILDTELNYTEEMSSNLAEDQELQLNQSYTVDYLIQRTARLSDNVAFNLLVDNLPSKFVKKVHQDLNIFYPSDTTPTDFISVKSYSSIFRVLYNSSYLSRKNSEYLLAQLSSSEFSEGLVAGVPQDIVVAHKFGIRNPSDSDKSNQLHDCGIIYHPTRPYLLCIMTRGNNQQEQTEAIKELSESIYNIIDVE